MTSAFWLPPAHITICDSIVDVGGIPMLLLRDSQLGWCWGRLGDEGTLITFQFTLRTGGEWV
jgi:hypothetical protein